MFASEANTGGEWHLRAVICVQQSVGILMIAFFCCIVSLILYSLIFDLIPYYTDENGFPVWVLVNHIYIITISILTSRSCQYYLDTQRSAHYLTISFALAAILAILRCIKRYSRNILVLQKLAHNAISLNPKMFITALSANIAL